jgi:hypothetical protein
MSFEITNLTKEQAIAFLHYQEVSKLDLSDYVDSEVFYRYEGDLLKALVGYEGVYDEDGELLPKNTVFYPLTPEIVKTHNHLVDIENIQEKIKEASLDGLTLTELRDCLDLLKR